MKKGGDNVGALMPEAAALGDLGRFRAALEKLRPALASQTNGDEAVVVSNHLTVIMCHAALDEVS